MNLKKIDGTAALAGALGAAALGLGAGSAQADPGWDPNIPWIPGPRRLGSRTWFQTTCGHPDRLRTHGAPGSRPVTGLGVHTGCPVFLAKVT